MKASARRPARRSARPDPAPVAPSAPPADSPERLELEVMRHAVEFFESSHRLLVEATRRYDAADGPLKNESLLPPGIGARWERHVGDACSIEARAEDAILGIIDHYRPGKPPEGPGNAAFDFDVWAAVLVDNVVWISILGNWEGTRLVRIPLAEVVDLDASAMAIEIEEGSPPGLEALMVTPARRELAARLGG